MFCVRSNDQAAYSLSLTEIFQHKVMMKDEPAFQGSLSWSTSTPLTPLCALSSDAWPCKECSHIRIQIQTLRHGLKTGSRLSNIPDLEDIG